MVKPKSIAKLKREVQTLFNAFIRRRDILMGHTFICISCGKEKDISFMNAGHLFSIKGYDHLRYNEDNCNGECSGCNGFNKNHQIWYSINLQKKIGEERWNALLNDAVSKPEKGWTREQLVLLLKKYKR